MTVDNLYTWTRWSERAPRQEDLLEGEYFHFADPDGYMAGMVSHVLPTYQYKFWRKCRPLELPKDDPKPDARSWWKMSEKRPRIGELIKVEYSTSPGAYYFCKVVNENIVTNDKCESVRISYVTKWCPLDMSGPVEE